MDPPTTTARPTATSLAIETSRRLGGGSRVPLNLSNVPSFSLFPGQVVGLRGVNASGSYFAVKEILVPQRLPCPDVSADELLTRGMRMIVASGPWGTDTGGWEGFEEICLVAQTESVDVLILVTPRLQARANSRWARSSTMRTLQSNLAHFNSLRVSHRPWNPSLNNRYHPVYAQ